MVNAVAVCPDGKLKAVCTSTPVTVCMAEVFAIATIGRGSAGKTKFLVSCAINVDTTIAVISKGNFFFWKTAGVFPPSSSLERKNKFNNNNNKNKINFLFHFLFQVSDLPWLDRR